MAGEQVTDPRTVRADLGADLAGFLGRACAPYRSERFAIAPGMKDRMRLARFEADRVSGVGLARRRTLKAPYGFRSMERRRPVRLAM